MVAFYGHSYNPFKEGGIGRVAREIKPDGTMGPIYFIRYSSHAQWNETNTAYPFYTKSKDKGFREACQALLGDKLKTLQWIDEDRGLDGFYNLKDSINRVQATSYYHRKDGKTVALWKWSYAALSPDDGKTWSTPVRIPSLIMAGGKQWGQRTPDGRYAICYNPIETQPYRYPLIAISSDDGITYDSMCVVHGEVPPRRFMGENKDFGPCYVRGITEGEATPPGNDMWLAYTVNKEDVWVARVPTPIRTKWTGPVNDNFDNIQPHGAVTDWNIYRPRWADVYVNDRHQLCLSDSDRYDYARAIRVFEAKAKTDISLDVQVAAENDDPFEVDVTDRHGVRIVCVSLHGGKVVANGETVGSYKQGEWLSLNIRIVDGGVEVQGHKLLTMHSAQHPERLSLRTGEYRDLPNRNTPNQEKCPPLPGCDERIAPAMYIIDNVRVD